jgi:hypothetical protein
MTSMRLLRLLAIAVAIAVPIQGMAAVTAGQCMAFGHHEPGAGHDGHGESTHAPGDADASPTHEHDEQEPGDAHCGPCAACCASASIAGAVPVPVFSSHANTKYVLSQAAPPGIAPQRLDRPPLSL